MMANMIEEAERQLVLTSERVREEVNNDYYIYLPKNS